MKEFKPYDKVLAKVYNNIWEARFFSHIDDHKRYHLTSGATVEEKNILLFEGNEHLLGTTNKPKEEITLKEGERIVCSDCVDFLLAGDGYINRFADIDKNNDFLVDMLIQKWLYCIPFSQFKEKNTKHDILYVQKGKLVRYE